MGCANPTDGNKKKLGMVVTCGPSLNTPERIAEMIKLGVEIIRINFSHGGPEDYKKLYNTIQEGIKLAGKTVNIAGDIQGPKFRVGMFEGR